MKWNYAKNIAFILVMCYLAFEPSSIWSRQRFRFLESCAVWRVSDLVLAMAFSAELWLQALFMNSMNMLQRGSHNGTYNSLRDRYRSTIVGGSLLSLFNPLREVQLSAEFETLNVSP